MNPNGSIAGDWIGMVGRWDDESPPDESCDFLTEEEALAWCQRRMAEGVWDWWSVHQS